MAYEPAERDLSDLPFDHPDDVDDSQPQTVLDCGRPDRHAVRAGGVHVELLGDHAPGGLCTQHRFAADAHHSYGHINSLQMVDGLVIASLRGCSKVLAIDPDHTENHKVVWRVGRSNLTAEQWKARGVGPAPMAVVGDPAGEFCGQHAAQILPSGNLLLFDNGVHCLVNPWTGEFRRARGRRGTTAARWSTPSITTTARRSSCAITRCAAPASTWGTAHGQVEPLDQRGLAGQLGPRPGLSCARRPGEVPVEAVTQVDPDTGEEKFSLRDPDRPLTILRSRHSCCIRWRCSRCRSRWRR